MLVDLNRLKLNLSRFVVPALVVSVIATVLSTANFEHQKTFPETTLEHACICTDAETIAKAGAKALRRRVPGALINGMLDPNYCLIDFENAALKLAPNGNADAQFILGWLCENGNCHTPDPVHYPIEVNGIGQQNQQKCAAKWYEMASMHGSSEASIALGNLMVHGYEGSPKNHLQQSAFYYRQGIRQGDQEARVHLAYNYAHGLGVEIDGVRAWQELKRIIVAGDEDNSTFAVVIALQLWNDGMIAPSEDFCHGAQNAYEFAKRYDQRMTKEELDNLYSYHGFTPDPYPQMRWELAAKIRSDFLKVGLQPSLFLFSNYGKANYVHPLFLHFMLCIRGRIQPAFHASLRHSGHCPSHSLGRTKHLTGIKPIIRSESRLISSKCMQLGWLAFSLPVTKFLFHTKEYQHCAGTLFLRQQQNSTSFL